MILIYLNTLFLLGAVFVPTRPSRPPVKKKKKREKGRKKERTKENKLATSLPRILKNSRIRIFSNCRAEILIPLGTDATNVSRHSDSVVTHKVPRLSLDLTRQTAAVSMNTEDCPHWLSRQICSNFILITYRVLLHNDGLF